MPTTTGMKSDGFYDAHSSAQRATVDGVLPWLEEALADLPILPAQTTPATLLDIGSSEGGNAIYAMHRLATKLRSSTALPIWLFFSDLPTNDYNHLFTNLYPNGVPGLPVDNVFAGAIAGTAFGRLLPANSLYVATTFNAIGFLDHEPETKLPDFILPMGPGPLAPRAGVGVTERERGPFRQQSEQDLRNFYKARAEELVSGGKLLVQVFGRNEKYSTSDGIYDVLSDAILDLVELGTIPQCIYEELVFPIYFRTVEELVAPIDTDNDLSKIFHLEKSGHQDVPIPFNEELEQTGNIAKWASQYMGFLRAFTEAILASALPADMKTAKTLDAVYRQVEQRLRDEPSRYEFHFISVAALLTRV